MQEDGGVLKAPPQLSDNDIEQGIKLIRIASLDPRPPLNSEPSLMASLYYPLRQVPLPSFQFEMLVWENDKQNVFSDSKLALKFFAPADIRSTRPLIGYKRADPFTVLALACFDSVCVVYTNEVSQSTWEIIGVFSLKDLDTHLKENRHSLVSYDSIESSYSHRIERAQKLTEEEAEGNVNKKKDSGSSDSDDGYWDKYDEDSEQETTNKDLNDNSEDEEAYWNKHTEEPPKLDSGTLREHAVQALVDLADLYKDCGLDDVQIISEDILSIGLGGVPPQHETPQIAHKHAMRTIAWVKSSNPYYQEEILACVQSLKNTSL